MGKLASITWWKQVGYMSVRTMAQTAVSMVTVGNLVTEMDWVTIGSIALGSGIACVLTQVAILPDPVESEE
ncbi:MAG: holin [Eubacteriales bacterium]